ncbi:colorectal mutant cancer protein isoform X2 [Scaptodrosophila lebanonensis]|uniref:Colorectal mutant cancer protein isoform X2 n=1 Tax=Drosophila lebanonensis TaxID=7225 RepID=A0A6J2T432_DROLE|nr:colorectal mutant cancer protein isoform X2 [Scaptodrosophila lebanonensis]
MSNDVQIARVAKITTDVPRRHGKQQLQQQKQASNNTNSRISKGVDEDMEYVFGSISPRGGAPNAALGHQKHLVGSYDLDSPEHTQRDTTESDNNISSCSTLDIVNKVEQLSVQQMEVRVRDLTQRLQQAEEQRSALQRQLNESNVEKEMCHKRLEVVSAAHECRLTEMHCVIAELSKKLRSKQDHIIMEEQEPEGSELSYQEGSLYNSELNLTNPDAECQTEPLEDLEGAYSAGEELAQSAQNICLDSNHIKMSQETVNKGQLEALQEEVLHLRAQIALLQAEIATKDDLELVVEEQTNVAYFACDVDADEGNNKTKQKNKSEQQLNDLNMSAQNVCVSLSSPQKRVPPVAKMAERVKLRCASKDEPDERNVSNLELISNEHIDLVEHLVCELKEHNSLMDSFMDPLQLSNELQDLQRKMEHLKMRNTLLSLTLAESKEHTEHLYLLCGKYESNAVALQLAVNCSDRAIEAYDVMLALLESKLALLNDKSQAAEESRLAVESVARHLLARLESEKNVCENSLGPWQHNLNLNSEATKNSRNWTADDDNRLRYHVSKLKGRRSTVQHTIVNLESPFSDFYEKKRLALEEEEHKRDTDDDEGGEKKSPIDLESAVALQELLELREQNLQLKTKVEEVERERQRANERIGVLHEALKQLQLQLSVSSSAVLFQQQTKRASYSEAEHAAVTEQQLVEALTREMELKGRIQTLLANVAISQKISDEKYEQLQLNVRELQKSNHKYQMRIRKLEQRISEQRQTDLLKHQAAKLHNQVHVPETTL